MWFQGYLLLCYNIFYSGIVVADYPETIKYLSEIWLVYYEERCSIEDIIQEYDKHGFEANQDFPGNGCWEELYNSNPDCKGTFLVHQVLVTISFVL